jgi:hypothetical protein
VKVAIIGPNLLDQSTGGFHVHKFGCADTKKSQYRFHKDDVNYAYEVETIKDIVTEVYDPGDFDYDADNPSELAGYASDIHIFPCVGTLPDA